MTTADQSETQPEIQTEPQMKDQLKELQAENDLLLQQLHQVQEELERYYLRNQDLEKNGGAQSKSGSSVNSTALPNEDALAVQAENLRLKALVEAQRQMHHLETTQSLNAKLGDLLITAADHPIQMLGLPFKLFGLWRQWGSAKPPKSLGGSNFSEIIARYKNGGLVAVEKLLEAHKPSPLICALALTTLARSLQNSDRAAVAKIARRAFEFDPKPYRLKWLAFRVYEAGDLIQAEALLDLLPLGTSLNESEKRQVDQIRRESVTTRQRQAKQQMNFDARCKDYEEHLKKITHERDQQTKLAATRAQEIQSLTAARKQIEEKVATLVQAREQEKFDLAHAKTQLEVEQSALTQRINQVETGLATSAQQIETLTQVRTGLETEKVAMVAKLRAEKQRTVEQQTQLQALGQEKALLTLANTQLETERATLTHRLTQTETSLHARTQQIDELIATRLGLEADKAALTARQQEVERFAVERQSLWEALTAAKLTAERATLTERLAQADIKLTARAKEIETLKTVKTRLETEHAARGQEVEGFKKTQARLEQEKTANAAKIQEFDRIIAEKQKLINDLQKKLTESQATEIELAERQQQIHDNFSRTETQISVIKDMLMSETAS